MAVSKVFDRTRLVVLQDDGLRRRVFDPTVQLEICTQQGDPVVRILNGTQVLYVLPIDQDLEIAKVGNRGLAMSCDADSFVVKFPKQENVKEFQAEVSAAKSRQADSIFYKRTDTTSAEQYFQFYGYLSQQQNMMQDYVRTSTYQRAMLENAVDFNNKVVLDVGAGSGILSFFAIQAGAKKVYAIEASSMAQHCESLVQSNMLSDQIVVIGGKIEELDLPEKVDIIVSEPMGYMLFNERMLETYLHAKKWLKPGGKMFPTKGDLQIVPFTDDSLYMEMLSKANFWHQPSFHGVDLTSLRDPALSEYFRQPVVDTFDIRICLSEPFKYTVDFATADETDLHDMDIPVSFTILQSGTVHGLAFWFDVEFSGSQSTVLLSTSPTQPLTHWYQVRCLLQKPIFVKQGQTLTGRVQLQSNKRQSYDINLEVEVEGTDIRSNNTLDLKNPCFRYTGQQVQAPPGSNHLSPTDAYWNQQDCTATLDQLSPDSGYGIALLNGGITDGSQYVQVSPSGAVFNNFIPVAVGDINPGSIPTPIVAPLGVASNQNHTPVGSTTLPGGFVLEHTTQVVVNPTQFPLSSSLMIGDYMVPNNIVLPSAQQGVNILHYKTVGDV